MTQKDLDRKSGAPQELLIEIRTLIEEARRQTAAAVNIGLTVLYWRVGRRIRREVLDSERAPYGEQIVVTASRQLIAEYGWAIPRRIYAAWYSLPRPFLTRRLS